MSIFKIIQRKMEGRDNWFMFRIFLKSWMRHKTRFFNIGYWKYQYIEWSIPKNLTVAELNGMLPFPQEPESIPEPLPVPAWEFYKE